MHHYNPDAAITGNHLSFSQHVAPEGDTGNIRGGILDEITRRATAWLNWRAGLAPKPNFKSYNPRDRTTWFRAPALDVRIQRRAARALMFAKLAKERKKK